MSEDAVILTEPRIPTNLQNNSAATATATATASTTTTEAATLGQLQQQLPQSQYGGDGRPRSDMRRSRMKTMADQKFQHAKMQCLYGHKRDKSSVGQLDEGVKELCALINENFAEYYTTSSCAGRCFLYTGMGIKSTNTFVRCRISHQPIRDALRYFNLNTLHDDPTGGGDVIPQIYDGGKRQRQYLRRRRHHQQIQESSNRSHEDGADVMAAAEDEEDDDEEEEEGEEDNDDQVPDTHGNDDTGTPPESIVTGPNHNVNQIWWIRYEPFILHVACRSLPSAIQFMNIVRPIFKTVGITSLSHAHVMDTDMDVIKDGLGVAVDTDTTTSVTGCPKYVVAVYGDEGLDMPLTNEHGISMISDTQNYNVHNSENEYVDNHHCATSVGYTSHWLASLVNERHERNANKIERLVQAIRTTIEMNETKSADAIDNDEEDDINVYDSYNDGRVDIAGVDNGNNILTNQYGSSSNSALVVQVNGQSIRVPRSYDVIGDVAILHTLPSIQPHDNNHNHNDENHTDNEEQSTLLRKAIGEAIIQRNKNIKVVVLRNSNLDGHERAPGMNGIQILTGPTDRIQRLPLITTHREYGISCVVNIHHTFFSPRMGQERVRICEQIQRHQQQLQHNEHVLVLFAGVCMDVFQIAARTTAMSVTAIEANEYAIECAQKGHLLLERNKQCLHNHAAQRVQILHGDCLQIIPTLPRHHYHRILAPRPKEGNLDGDQPATSTSTSHEDVSDTDVDDRIGGSGGMEFLIALLSVLRPNGGICHWYDFCADHEYPQCHRTVQFISNICQNEYQYSIEIIHIAHVGSVAKRQLRICVDFRISQRV